MEVSVGKQELSINLPSQLQEKLGMEKIKGVMPSVERSVVLPS